MLFLDRGCSSVSYTEVSLEFGGFKSLLKQICLTFK